MKTIKRQSLVLLSTLFLVACSSTKKAPEPVYVVPAPSSEPKPASIEERVNVRMELAKKYITLKQYELASKTLDEVLKKQETLQGTHLKAIALMGMQDYKNADIYFRKTLAKDKSPDLLNNYGWFLCKQRNMSGLDYLNQAEPRANAYLYPKVLANKGACYVYTKDYVKATANLNRSLELMPNYIPALIYSSFIMAKQNNTIQAEANLNNIGVANVSEPELLWIGINVFKISGNAISTKLWGNFLVSEFPNSQEAMRYHRNDVEQ